MLLVLGLALLAAGCGSDAAKKQQAAAARRARAHAALVARQVAAGRNVFAAHCASCHTIEGHVAHPTFIESPIPNLDEVKLPKAEYVTQRVETGGFDMPTVMNDLKPGELQQVVAYVTAVAGSRVVDTGASDASALTLGQQVFAANCTRCHTLAGKPYTDRSVTFPGTNFDNVKPSQRMVIERVTRGISEEMPSFRHKLSAAQIHAVAVYVTATAGR